MKDWNEEKIDYIRTSSMFSLAGEAYPALRAILFNFSGDKNLDFRFYLERNPTGKDEECLRSYTQCMDSCLCGDLDFDCDFDSVNYNCILFNEPISNHMDLGIFLYARKESTGKIQFYQKNNTSVRGVYAQKCWIPIGFAKVLIGKIYKEIRMIMYHHGPDGTLLLYCIFDREPTHEDHANMQEIINEFFDVISGENREKITSTKITCWFSEEGPLNRYYTLIGWPHGRVLYQRVEYEFMTGFEYLEDEE